TTAWRTRTTACSSITPPRPSRSRATRTPSRRRRAPRRSSKSNRPHGAPRRPRDNSCSRTSTTRCTASWPRPSPRPTPRRRPPPPTVFSGRASTPSRACSGTWSAARRSPRTTSTRP
ncbi:hypothetical protein BN1708_019693, partial [Verticillium longisporum]